MGISAGLSQYHSNNTDSRPRSNSRPRTPRDMHTSSPRLHAVDAGRSKASGRDLELSSGATRDAIRKNLQEQPKSAQTLMRVDAFLGEWLNPDYFDKITPPPNSTLMVAGAKADLLRSAEGIDAFLPNPSNKATQGSLWGSARVGAQTEGTVTPPNGALENMKSLSHTLPTRDRTSSLSGGRANPYGRASSTLAPPTTSEVNFGYVAPTPSYAVAPTEPIPKGYVAHARDVCSDVDYQWDSMREPLSWGDGGEYGEEWGPMHKRFRKGLKHMIEWYDEHGAMRIADEQLAVSGGSIQEGTEEDDSDADIALVLVTHAAGCNALVGALTDQPVLLDVGTASLTMAVRRSDSKTTSKLASIERPHDSAHFGDLQERRGSVTFGLSSYYDMKLVASTDHLRAGVDPARPASPQISSNQFSAAKTVPESRRRSTLLSHTASGSIVEQAWQAPESGRGNTSTAIGSVRRPSLSPMVSARSGSISSMTNSAGLWAPSTPPLLSRVNSDLSKEAPVGEAPDISVTDATPRAAHTSDELGITYSPERLNEGRITDSTNGAHDVRTALQDFALTASPVKPTSVIAPPIPEVSDGTDESDNVSSLPAASVQPPTTLGRTLSQKGLWGSAPTVNMHPRDRGPKRRWTVQQE